MLSINGKIIRGSTHKEALDLLRAPRSEVVLVLSRPGLPLDTSEALDEGLPCTRAAGTDTDASSQAPRDKAYKTISAVLPKDGAGLGFILEGGKDSPLGDRPLIIKKMFKGRRVTR